jgi:hypothetical protein
VPRPRKAATDDTGAGVLLGALLGGLVGRSPAGAAAGAAVGGLLTSQGPRQFPVPLELALEQLIEQHNAEFVAFHRVGARGGRLAFRSGDSYRWLSSSVGEDLVGRDQIDDAIYDDLKAKFEAWLPKSA